MLKTKAGLSPDFGSTSIKHSFQGGAGMTATIKFKPKQNAPANLQLSLVNPASIVLNENPYLSADGLVIVQFPLTEAGTYTVAADSASMTDSDDYKVKITLAPATAGAALVKLN